MEQTHYPNKTNNMIHNSIMKDKKITLDDIEISRTDNSVLYIGNSQVGNLCSKLNVRIRNTEYSIAPKLMYDNDYVLKINDEDNTVIQKLIETIIRYMIACGESKIYYPNEDKLIVY